MKANIIYDREPKSWGHILFSFIGLIVIVFGTAVIGAGYLLVKLGAIPLRSAMKPQLDFIWVNIINKDDVTGEQSEKKD